MLDGFFGVMDQRITFGTLDELKNILSDLQRTQARASLLIDRDGLTRVEGMIMSLQESNPSLGQTTFRLEGPDSAPIHLQEVIAVNGIFRSDFSEC